MFPHVLIQIYASFAEYNVSDVSDLSFFGDHIRRHRCSFAPYW